LVIKLNTETNSDFLDTLDNVTFKQYSLEMGPLENFPETKQPIQNIILYFSDDNNKRLARADGKLISVQAEGQPQIEGKDANGNVVPATDGPTSLLFNAEKFTYTQQLNSYVNALFRQGLERTDLILYPTSPSANADEFKQSLKEMIVDKNTIKLKIYYSKVK